MSDLTVEIPFHVHHRARGRKKLVDEQSPTDKPAGRIPRVAKLMALAIRFDGLVQDGVVTDQAELARLGQVTRARLTQIMNLLNLAPDIQEAILHLPRAERGRDPITERELRPMAAELDWKAQRIVWTK